MSRAFAPKVAPHERRAVVSNLAPVSGRREGGRERERERETGRERERQREKERGYETEAKRGGK